jgi:DNA methylase
VSEIADLHSPRGSLPRPSIGSLHEEEAEAQTSLCPMFALSPDAQERLIEAARSRAQVSGLTHNFYRYPARFSPEIARAAIQCFTEPGDLVADSFVGGGTTLVEALALNRDGIGTDVSTLAAFVSRVKTTLVDDDRLASVTRWTKQAADAINMHDPAPEFEEWADAGYLRHLDHRDRWRLRKALSQAVGWVPTHDLVLEELARCIILRTAQWALDGRKTIPTLGEFKQSLLNSAKSAVVGLQSLSAAVGTKPSKVKIVNRSAVGLECDADVLGVLGSRKPRLIVTSPPYPGVHVLYHRWQVDGRKETRAPFWIANTLDGAGASYYTMGDRKQPELTAYFDTLRAVQRSLAAVSDRDTTIVQVVAFSRPETQLARYNAAAEAAGLEEVRLPALASEGDGRLWREVPNRKWYTGQRAATSASNEVVLFYRLAR